MRRAPQGDRGGTAAHRERRGARDGGARGGVLERERAPAARREAAATKAHVSVALIERAEEHRTWLVEEEERVRREAEAKAKAEAEAAAKRREAAAAERRRMMDEANDEGLRAAIAAAAGARRPLDVDGAGRRLTKLLEEARIRREEELKAAEMTLEAALDLGDADAISDARSMRQEAGVDDCFAGGAGGTRAADARGEGDPRVAHGLERAIDGDDDDDPSRDRAARRGPD